MAFDDPEFQRQWERQRAAAEYRQEQLGDRLRRASATEAGGEFLVAAEWYDQARWLVSSPHERAIFRTRASQMRRLAKNGGDYDLLAHL